jgi:hypothetical protein
LKLHNYILTLVIGLLSFQPNQVYNADFAIENIPPTNNSAIYALRANADQETSTFVATTKLAYNSSKETSATQDSAIYLYDSLFVDLNAELKEIPNSKFSEYEKKYKTSCTKDSTGFIKDKGLIIEHACDEVCVSYLTDIKEKIKLILPSAYDRGIIDLVISPDCKRFIVYSSYDGPDYTNYYEYRAEIFGFTIAPGQGIKTIQPAFKFFTKDWSIEKITWISNTEIGLKTYEASRTLKNEEQLVYKYFGINVKK